MQLRKFLICLILNVLTVAVCRAQGTAFTYQGRLNDGPNPASGRYDLRFKLFADALGNTQVGNTAISNAVPVSGGLFVVTLDFGSVFNGSNYWLEVDVKTNGAGAYANLSPLQPITPTPYAVFAQSVANGAGLTAGTYSNAVNLSNAANTFAGSFTGDGSGLSNVTVSTFGGLTPNGFWKTSGNNGTVPGANFLGTTDTQPLELRVNSARALRIESGTGNTPNMIGGSGVNFVDAGVVGATIGGGGTTSTNYYLGSTSNRVAAIFGTIAGGRGQTVAADHAFIGGGINNFVQTYAYDAVVGGGVGNVVQSNAYEAVIAGGINNSIYPNGGYSFIGGGSGNSISQGATFSAIGGGNGNSIRTNAQDSFLGGGYNNLIQPGSVASVISGGGGHIIQNNAGYAVIAGGLNNSIQTNASYSTVGGGTLNSIQTNSFYSTIAGGGNNSVRSNAPYSSIGGGWNNAILNNSSNAFLGGGISNVAGGIYSTLVGGGYNTSSGRSSFVGGGGGYNFLGQGPFPNIASGDWTSISGGYNNTASSQGGTIGGGGANLASGPYATIAGGELNRATNTLATVGGGQFNIASGYSSTVPGGLLNVASGGSSFAAGQNASALHDGSFVWADSSSSYTFPSTAANQFSVRAVGGVRVVGNLSLEGGADGAYRRLELSGGNSLGFVYGSYPYFGDGVHLGYNFYADSAGNPNVINPGGGSSRVTAGYGEVVIGVGPPGFGPNQVRVDVTTSGVTLNGTVTVNGTFVNNSDRNAKRNFARINSSELLDKVTHLPISQWNYKEESSSIQHIGPMAQDFYSIFNIGLDERHIAPIDEGGVALAAIQGLNEKLEVSNQKLAAKSDRAEEQIQKLEAENAALKRRLEKLERVLQTREEAASE